MKTCLFLTLVLIVTVGCQAAPPPAPTPVSPTSAAISPPSTSLPIATATLVLPTATEPLARSVASLQGLDFDAFLAASYDQLLLRRPQKITELGLAAKFGMRNDQLNNLSDEYLRETQRLESAILTLLRSYDRTKLSPEQQLWFDIYVWYLDNQERGHAFMYDDYPLSLTIASYDQDLTFLFTDIHPVISLQDAQDYVTRLSKVNTQAEQVIDGLKRRQALGVVLPKFYFRPLLDNLRRVTDSAARTTPFYTAFDSKVKALRGVSDSDKQVLLQAAEQQIAQSVQPGFRSLIQFLEQQQQAATNDAGVWKFPNGADYYAYVLRTNTTTNMTADEIHALGLHEVARIQDEIRSAAHDLGYPTNESISALFARAAHDGGSLQGTEVVKGYEGLVQNAQNNLNLAFNRQPRVKVIVVGVPTGGYYTPPSVDGSRPGAFYASTQGTVYKFTMPTTAYHEAIPGHHLQIALQGEMGLPLFRYDVPFNGYVEGWALYAEQLAWEQGFYKNDPYGNLGRLQAELYRAARLVVDTGINAKKWSYDQAVSYMLENTGLPRESVEPEVARYICWPGQATSYKIGMLKILELRQKAQHDLGARFDLKEFHAAVIGNGSMPLELLERVVNDYISQKSQ